MCEVQSLPDDPEDGITRATESWLIDRRANTKIEKWESLWNLLFPDDEAILPFGMWSTGSRCPFTR